MSSLTVEEDQKWLPTHVQVTVLRARGLRGKGKHGTSDVYTIIQLGKEKYSTGVAEKTTEPEWREECSFELLPGVLESGERGGHPAGSTELVLTVMHRALMGLDVFLGQAGIQLDKLFQESRCVKNEWYRLNSKTGKKEKERGDIQVTIQFTRNNLTASMYDLVMKDKGASTFSKLKERMRGKRRSSEDDSSSSVLPGGGYGSLYRMRQRLPSDGGGEEDYEDDEGGEVRRSKMRTFFLRGKLRKSSDTRSSTSLGSESSESSSRGGSLSPTAGISVVVSDLSNSPSNSSNFTADNSPEHTTNTSPKSSSLKCEFGHETSEVIIAVPQPTVCVNESHAYVKPLDQGSGKPAGSLGLGLLQKSLPLSVSLQNLSTRACSDLPKGLVGDGRRWSFDRPGEEEKAAIAAALEKSGPKQGEEEEWLKQKSASTSSALKAESETQGKKQRKNLFSHGRGESGGKGQSRSKDESEQVSAASQEKHKGWFGSKDPHSKPSLVVFTKLEPSTDPKPPPFLPSHHPLGPLVDSASVISTLHHINPFCHSQTALLLISPCNPFYSLQQHNPFYEDILTTQLLKTSPPPLPYLSSSRPPITLLFPQPSNPILTHDNPAVEDIIMDTDPNSKVTSKVEERPLSPVPMERKEPLCQKSSNPFMSDPDSEWNENFAAFAACRLHSTEDLTTECRTQQNAVSDHPLEHYYNKSELWPVIDVDENTNVNDSLYHQPEGTFLFEMSTVPSQAKYNNTYHNDPFHHFLETIPEQRIFESNDITLNTSPNSPKLSAFTETEHNNNITNGLTEANVNPAASHISATQLNGSSPDLSTSGLGSSAEDDGLSYFSCQSDKFSASSSEETENNTLHVIKSAVVKNVEPSEPEDSIADTSNDLLLIDVSQQKITIHEDNWENFDLSSSEKSLTPQMPTLKSVTAKWEMESESEDTRILNSSNLYPDLLLNPLEPQLKSIVSSQLDNENGEESTVSTVDFSKDFDCFMKNTTDGMTHVSPFDELPSTVTSLHITTSSPDAKHDLLDASFENTDFGKPEADVPFSYFSDFLDIGHIENSPRQVFDSNLLQAQTSDQNSRNFLQSLYVSSDMQDYQTCDFHPSFKVFGFSDQNKSLHSANSTICGDLSDIQTTTGVVSSLEDCKNGFMSSEKEISQTSGFKESLNWTKDKMENLETRLTVRDGLQILPAPLPDSDMSCNPKDLNNGELKNQHGTLPDMFSNCAHGHDATLHRSQSEGALTPSFNKILLPSFGSNPSLIQRSFSALVDPDFPMPISFASPLIPESNSTPVALCALSPLANISATMPLSPAQGSAPKPVLDKTEQQWEAANQQSSLHPVKPLTTAMLAEEKRSVLATGLEKLKSTIHPGRSSQTTEQEMDRRKSLTEGAGSYYHLTHSELITLLVQREAELEKQKAEFEHQKRLLAKREVELKKLKPQVKDLEDYIDTLLVRIMEQKPTLLQVRSKFK
ncbi:uncharacterized protein rab11fip5a isoform X1 [Kryptolebias marmoratus]|uniref:Rab11 family-interacting protein 5-like n=1 Tax=Kryptolebias marmoratus TaxID=37003 RepID=A0A3Q3AYV1_KRYMA|nr:uncharacterized protein rab11fip5a isoform X1 [Kryptolebias marmoratus]